jgi:hypothetical protein
MFETINEQMQKFHWQYRVDITKFKKRISRKGIARRSDMITRRYLALLIIQNFYNLYWQ